MPLDWGRRRSRRPRVDGDRLLYIRSKLPCFASHGKDTGEMSVIIHATVLCLASNAAGCFTK